MTRSMRSRFRDELPPAPTPGPDEPGGGGGGLTLFGHILLVLLLAGFFSLSVWWALNDVSGEYQGYSQPTGMVQLTLLRKPANIKGSISYGSAAPLTITGGSVRGNKVELTFALDQELVQSGMVPRHATFHGTLENGVLSGTLEEGGYKVDLTMSRNAIASLYRQIQSHLPWTG